MSNNYKRVYLSPINKLINKTQSYHNLFTRVSKDISFSQINILAKDSNNKLINVDVINNSNFNKWLSSLSISLSKKLKSEYNEITKNHLIANIFPEKNPLIMGVLNITDDSFYDGGKYINSKNAIKYAKNMVLAGADIIDVGGESTKPGSKPLNIETEISRVIPIIKELNNLDAMISCDTRNYDTMLEAIKAGAQIINDVSGFNNNKNILNLIAEKKCFYVITHSKGNPDTMQKNPSYSSAVLEVYEELLNKIKLALEAGVKKSKIFIDPGIGFGKLDKHNFEIINFLPVLLGLGCPIMIGTSRKSLIGRALNNIPAKDRMPASIALSLDAFQKGARVLRVHDVKETSQAISLFKLANMQ